MVQANGVDIPRVLGSEADALKQSQRGDLSMSEEQESMTGSRSLCLDGSRSITSGAAGRKRDKEHRTSVSSQKSIVSVRSNPRDIARGFGANRSEMGSQESE